MSIVKILEKTDCLIMASRCTCNILPAGASCRVSVFSNMMARYWDMVFQTILYINKANLTDLIAATGLVILLKFDPNHQFSACVTLKFDG